MVSSVDINRAFKNSFSLQDAVYTGQKYQHGDRKQGTIQLSFKSWLCYILG